MDPFCCGVYIVCCGAQIHSRHVCIWSKVRVLISVGVTVKGLSAAQVSSCRPLSRTNPHTNIKAAALDR